MPTDFNQTGTVAQLVNALQIVRQHDKYVEQELARSKRNATWWWVGFFVAFFGTLVLAGVFPPALYLTIPGGILALILAIIWSVKRSAWSKENIEDRRLEMPMQLLHVLGQDIPTRSRVKVQISFQPYKAHGQLVEAHKGGWLNPISTFKYTDAWFLAAGRLHDGNRFKVSIEQTIRRKEKRKRKYTKVNERFDEEVTLVLHINMAAYPRWQALAPRLAPGVCHDLRITDATATPQGVRVTCTTAQGRALTGRGGSVQRYGMDALANADTLLRLFIVVYEQLQHCRAAEPAPGNAVA